MIVLSTAPSRISLFGGGTDLPNYSDDYGGAVINLAINIKQHTSLYSDDDLFGVQNRFPPQSTPNFYYELLKKYKIDGGHATKLICEFDGFIRSGLGSSGAAIVSLIGAINKQQGLGMSRHDIAESAWQHEIDFGIHTGRQDQYASVYGGLNYFRFSDKVDRMALSVPDYDEFISWLNLYYIGHGEKDHSNQKKFQTLDKKKLRSLDILKYITGLALPLFPLGKYEELAELLDLTWHYKKESNTVSNPEIDKVYDLAKKNGARGGKICGSGLGGYMIFMANPKEKDNLDLALLKEGIERVDFNIDHNGLDYRIL